jgi:hypothetical protein
VLKPDLETVYATMKVNTDDTAVIVMNICPKTGARFLSLFSKFACHHIPLDGEVPVNLLHNVFPVVTPGFMKEHQGRTVDQMSRSLVGDAVGEQRGSELSGLINSLASRNINEFWNSATLSIFKGRVYDPEWNEKYTDDGAIHFFEAAGMADSIISYSLMGSFNSKRTDVENLIVSRYGNSTVEVEGALNGIFCEPWRIQAHRTERSALISATIF